MEDIQESNGSLIDMQKQLICSDEFEKALTSGSERNIEIDGTLKENNRSNYDVFYDIMLRSRTDIQEILEKKKKNRTPAENEEFAKFKKQTSAQYKQVREMIYVDEDDTEENGVSATVSKKLTKLVDNISNVVRLMKYIGHNELENELRKNGIVLEYSKLEDLSECFTNDGIHQSMNSVFDSACRIQKEINDKRREITDNIFTLEVPTALQYDKDSNPSGIKPSDFSKLVQMQSKKIKAQSDDAKDKLDRQATNEAEVKHCDSIRSEILREKYISLMGDDADGE